MDFQSHDPTPQCSHILTTALCGIQFGTKALMVCQALTDAKEARRRIKGTGTWSDYSTMLRVSEIFPAVPKAQVGLNAVLLVSLRPPEHRDRRQHQNIAGHAACL